MQSSDRYSPAGSLQPSYEGSAVSWSSLSPEFRAFAEDELTPKQLTVFKLWLSGYGYRRIALYLEVGAGTVRGHFDGAMLKLRRHPNCPSEWPRGNSTPTVLRRSARDRAEGGADHP